MSAARLAPAVFVAVGLAVGEARADAPSDTPFVHIATDAPVTLERPLENGGVEAVCASPCNLAVDPGVYRIVGAGLSSSSTFALGGTRAFEVRASTGDSRLRTTAWVLAGIGAGVLLTGSALAFSEKPMPLVAGFFMIPVGAVLFLASIPFFVAGTTSVDVLPRPRAARVKPRFTTGGLVF